MIKGLAAASVALAVALAGCTSTSNEPTPISAPWRATDLPTPAVTAPAVTAPAQATAGAEPLPQISVQITTEAPDPPDAGSGGTAAHVDQSVTNASASYASTLVGLANGARADAGLGKLAVSSCSAKAARARAARALAKESLQHEPLPKCGNGWVGENLARHYGSPKAMHAAWMASPGHRENILRPEFTGIGVGCVAYSRTDPHKVATRASDVGGHVCSQVFVG